VVFAPVINEQKCVGCGLCVERCVVSQPDIAIKIDSYHHVAANANANANGNGSGKAPDRGPDRGPEERPEKGPEKEPEKSSEGK
jgi:ferredoxin